MKKSQASDQPAVSSVQLREVDWRYPQYDSENTHSPDDSRVIDINNDIACGDGPFGGGCGIWGGEISLRHQENGSSSGTSAPVLQMDLGGAGVTSLAWMSDSSLLAVGLGSMEVSLVNDRIMLIDPAAGEVALTLEGHLGQVTGLLFSPDGTRLASTSADGTVIVWNVAARP